jgi:hypothetical protein
LIIIEVRVYLNIMTKFCCMRSDFCVQNGGILKLNINGRKIESVLDALLKL